jgi:hypothetical protein
MHTQQEAGQHSTCTVCACTADQHTGTSKQTKGAVKHFKRSTADQVLRHQQEPTPTHTSSRGAVLYCQCVLRSDTHPDKAACTHHACCSVVLHPNRGHRLCRIVCLHDDSTRVTTTCMAQIMTQQPHTCLQRERQLQGQHAGGLSYKGKAASSNSSSCVVLQQICCTRVPPLQVWGLRVPHVQQSREGCRHWLLSLGRFRITALKTRNTCLPATPLKCFSLGPHNVPQLSHMHTSHSFPELPKAATTSSTRRFSAAPTTALGAPKQRQHQTGGMALLAAAAGHSRAVTARRGGNHPSPPL